MGSVRALFRIYAFLITFSACGTLASKSLDLDPGPVAPMASILIMVVAVAIIALEVRSWTALVWTAVAASALEICSLKTGLPFGVYEYSDRWIPTIPLGNDRFPLLLPLAWTLVVGGGFLWVRRFLEGPKAIFATAALAMVIDIPMERAMTDVFGYWKWTPPGPLFGAPIINSFGWFVTALLCAVAYRRVSLPKESYAPRVLGLFCLFVGFSGVVAFWDPAWVLLGLMGSAPFVIRKR